MGNYNFKRFIQILGGTFVATFIIIGLLRGHYGQIYINVLWEDFGTSLSIVSIIGFCLNKWMWKWSIFNGWLVPFPCLEGEWEGEMQLEDGSGSYYAPKRSSVSILRNSSFNTVDKKEVMENLPIKAVKLQPANRTVRKSVSAR